MPTNVTGEGRRTMDGRAPLLVVLDGCHLDGHLLGAKAASLDRLIAIGLPVPACAVLTSTAYRLSVVDGRLRDALDMLRTTPIPPPEEHPASRRTIDQLFLDAPLPRVVRTMIARLASWTADRPGGRVAVRSSATAEDLDAASFAGQYRSTLDVSADDVERAVRLTWASLWHPAPRTYRAHHGIGDDVEMAVLAMEMVDAVGAGVLFTRDPIGSTHDVRIESVAGLGELLVSGARTPEALVVPRSGAVSAARDVDAALGELVAASLDLERRLGRPQDVEWAVDHEHRLWFLQARPITTLDHRDADPLDRSLDDGFDVRPPGSPALTTAGIGEMAPGVVPPLVWEAVSRQLEGGFRTLFADLGAPLDDLERPHALVARVHGRAALDLDRMRHAAASIPGGSADELERRYFGVAVSDAAGRAPTKRAGPWHGVRLLVDRRRAVVESEIVTRAIAGVHRAEPPLATIDDDQLLALRARVLDLADRAAAAEIAVAALAAAAHQGVEATLRGHLGDDAVAVAHDATAPAPGAALRHGDDDPVTLDLGELDDATRTIIDDAGADDLDWQGARAALGRTLAGRTAISRWESLLARSGSTSIFAGPTWADAPELAWLDLCAHVRRDRHGTDAGTDAAAPLPAHERTQAALDALVARGHHVGPFRRRFLRREIDDARELLDRRERTKSALLVLGGFARRIDDELGRRLVEHHRVESVDDVRLLTTAEVTTLLHGVGGPSWSVLALRRRRHAAANAARPLPRLFRGRPEQPVDLAGGLAHDAAAGAPVFGWAASPGRYEGPARVLTSPASKTLRRGEVIVARATDASWAPLFLVAGAIVVEEGGPLSHAAIIARELGVPAVVNAPGIVDLVTAAGDGAHLTVDGTTGAVRLHPAHPIDELPIAPPRTPPDEVDLGRLGVFVTGLIGAGVLMSALVSITESVGSGSGARRAGRRSAGAAVNTADVVLHGTDRAVRSTTGLRSAAWYAAAGAIVAVAAALTLHAGLDRWRDGGDWAGIWLAFGLTGALPVAAALALLTAADRWPEVPSVVRRHVGAVTEDGRSRWWLLPRAHRHVITALAAVVGILLVAAVVAENALLSIDRPIYDAIGANRDADPWSPHWFGMYFGRPQVLIPIALVVALFTLRCRVLALAYPLAIVFGGVANMGIGHLVGRQRPPLSNHWYQSDSFPSGHAIEVTLLLGLAPLAVAVLVRRRWVGRMVRVVATAVLAVMLVDGVRDGSHWLSDHVAGFALALVAVVFVHALARTPELHHNCRDCPAMAIAERRERPEGAP
jgi:phosphohistidine swiveling domain-containing protein